MEYIHLITPDLRQYFQPLLVCRCGLFICGLYNCYIIHTHINHSVSVISYDNIL